MHDQRGHHPDPGGAKLRDQVVQDGRSPTSAGVADHHDAVGMGQGGPGEVPDEFRVAPAGQINPSHRPEHVPLSGEAHHHQAVGRVETEHVRYGGEQAAGATDSDAGFAAEVVHGPHAVPVLPPHPGVVSRLWMKIGHVN